MENGFDCSPSGLQSVRAAVLPSRSWFGVATIKWVREATDNDSFPG